MSIQQLEEKLQRHLIYLEQDQSNTSLQLTVGLLKAKILHHEEKIDDAITVLEQLEPNAEVAGLLALLYFDNHDAIKAESFAQSSLSQNPSNYEGLLVSMLLRVLRSEATLAEIDALIEINPQDSRLWFALGTTQMRHMNFPAAEQALSKATTIWPHFYDSWICSGWCQLLQNNLRQAELAYQQAVNIDATAADGWGGLALVAALQNKMTKAKQELDQADSLDPECHLAAITRIILANQSSPMEAAKQFNLTFPDVAPEINRMINHALLTMNTVDKQTLH